MKTILFAAAATVAVVAAATPAAAEGVRLEIHGGWDNLSANDDSSSGVVYGIGAGYDIAVGKKMEVGIDLSADLSSVDDCVGSVVLVNDSLCVNAKRDLAAALRLGYKVSERGTLYALAGYTNARFRATYTTPAGVVTRDSGNADGLRLGAGYQQDFGEKTYGKIEYRYSNYEDDLSRHQVLLGVGVKF